MNALVLFWLFLKGSLLSTGGFGNLPLLHDELLPRGWATERHFAESMTIGQVTPGPNGLWVISLGYMVGGIGGAASAMIAISIPPLLVLAIERFARRLRDLPAMEGFIRGLSLAVIGIFGVVMTRMLAENGLDIGAVAVAGAACALGATGRVPVFVILFLGALAGILQGS